LTIAGLAGITHVATSATIGLIGIYISKEISHTFAHYAETITGILLIVFGLGYTLYSIKKRHHHHGIPFLTKRLKVEDLLHEHIQGHVHNNHNHTHIEEKISGKKAGFGLVIIIGLSPCVALLPFVFATAPMGIEPTILVILSFSFFTITTILLMTTFVSKGLEWIKLEFFERYGDIIAGLVIALIGGLTIFFGI